MALAYNDLVTRARTIRTTTGNAVVTGPCRIFGAHVVSASGATGTVSVFDALTATTATFIVRAPLDTSASVDFGPTGLLFTTGLTISSTGTPDGLSVSYMVE